MLSSRFPRRALRHVLRGSPKNGSSPGATRDQTGSLSRTINEISAKGLLALSVSWSLAEIALVFTTPNTPTQEHIVELPIASPPMMEVAETSRLLSLTPVTFWSNGE